MYYDTLNSEEQVSYLIKPILEVLQAAGGHHVVEIEEHQVAGTL